MQLGPELSFHPTSPVLSLLSWEVVDGEEQAIRVGVSWEVQHHDPDSGSGDTEWWDDKLHARGSSKTWDSLPPSKRKKAPLVSGILPPAGPERSRMAGSAPELGEGEGYGRESDKAHVWSFGFMWLCLGKSSCQEFFVGLWVSPGLCGPWKNRNICSVTSYNFLKRSPL